MAGEILLLDENLPRSAGLLLAAAGYAVRYLSDLSPASDDRRVMALARDQQAVLVTFDADFGELIFRDRVPPPPAVLYLRLHPIDGRLAAELVLRALEEPADGEFVVCTRDNLRRRAMPSHPDQA